MKIMMILIFKSAICSQNEFCKTTKFIQSCFFLFKPSLPFKVAVWSKGERGMPPRVTWTKDRIKTKLKGSCCTLTHMIGVTTL